MTEKILELLSKKCFVHISTNGDNPDKMMWISVGKDGNVASRSISMSEIDFSMGSESVNYVITEYLKQMEEELGL